MTAARGEASALAVERVLRAERDAEAALDQARRDAQAVVEAARAEALATARRTAQRIARWQRGHAEALARRVAALRERAEVVERPPALPDDEATAAAVAQVAARLTGADAAVGGSKDDADVRAC